MNRKEFLRTTGLAAVGAGFLPSCSGTKEQNANEVKVTYTRLRPLEECYAPELADKAIDGQPLRAGIVGCGSRGGGAANDFLSSGDGLTITHMADIFTDRLEYLRNQLQKDRGQNIPDENIFYGFDAFKKLCAADIDIVIIGTPTVFHAEMMKCALENGKHVFCEKPMCVDPTGYRQAMLAVKLAQSKKLSVVTGTQRHHDRPYIESYKKIQEGMIGKITGGQVYWNQGNMWQRNKEKGWTDMEWMLRDFFSWNWLCGDHILDQGVHNVDVFCWFSHLKPVKCVGFGSRLRRDHGNIWDNFSIDYEFEGGVHVHGMFRQIDGCANNVSETIVGTKGTWNSREFAIRDLDGNLVWQFDRKANEEKYKQNNPYVLEHMNLVNSIRSKQPICLAETTAISSLACVMGRESAYTGAEVTWDQITQSPLNLMPEKLELCDVDWNVFGHVPKPGV